MHKAVKGTVTVVAVVLVLGGVAGAAFYQEEVGGFFRLQGWNTGPVTDATREFVAAAAEENGQKVASFLAQGSPTLNPELKNDRVIAFNIADYGGPKRRKLKEMCPSASPQLTSPKLVFLEGGSVSVDAVYPSHKLQLRWDRKPEGWRLVDIGWAQ